MPAVERTETFNASIEQVFEAISDFESYPEFVDGVEEVKILKKTKKKMKVKYKVNMIKETEYTVEVKLDEPNSISWKLVEGKLFKKNSGYWEFEEISAKKTEVTYGLDIEFNIFAPKMVVNKLIKTSLPLMMKSFHKHAKKM